MPANERWWITSLALVLAAYAIDTIPNALFVNLPLVAAGALSRVLSERAVPVAAAAPATAPAPDATDAPPRRRSGARPLADLLGGGPRS
jgi:hypothetical protein